MARHILPLFFLVVPFGVYGQEGVTLGVMPRVGLFSPDTYFYEEFAEFGSDQPNEWTNGALGRSAYVGLGLEVGLRDRGIMVRGELGRTFEGWLHATHAIVQPRVGFDPPEIVYTYLDIPTTLTFASLQVVLPTQFEPWGLRPYFLLGGGGKWYGFGESTRPNEVEAILPSNGFTASLELGAGLGLTLWGLDFDAQIRDGLSKYWGKYQNDLVFSGGLVWRIR